MIQNLKEEHSTIFDFRSARAKDANSEHLRIRGIDRASQVPLHHQLYLLILSKIESGEWVSDSAIPGDRDLCERYDLSRTTVRQALQQLVSDGYLHRRRGQGTFVSKLKIRHGPQRSFGISGYLRARGLEPGWCLLRTELVVPPVQVTVALGLEEDHQALEIHRLRLADKEAIGVHIAHVPFPLAERVRTEHLTQGDSSLSYLEESLGIILSESHRVIQAVPAAETEAELLGVHPGSPLLLVQRVTIDADGKPVEYLRASYRGDRFEYYVHLEH